MNDLHKLFPNASAAFLARNGQGAREVAELESSPGPASLATAKAQGANQARLLVRIESVRRRLLDEDNLCEKYHVDLLRYCGLIPDDSPDKVRIETTQRKAAKGEEEHTLIEVFAINI